MTLQEFAQHYLPPEQKRMAMVTLSDGGDRTLQEWRVLWRAKLNSPSR